ncbi:MarR family winged helix-turn-helix transcriptional regulator [Dechloromonas denitrificans]|uniref:MarR family winged helix-turn-helix transcriptional regulator n=1 Tax=Dechloromonas denitrificans TaxID=281362 RepID=UPI001CF8C6C8|nr:MarR family transcriptional regulator [Dechloromonas denitrificans]UCV05177.1 MarR family transcriptional regulator [Dechloromonas denitrificans]UCV09535.1 MarR family transcriptional regulator [Dechloromonas denitrificans]
MDKNTRMDSHQWDSSLDPQISPLFLALQWAHRRSIEVIQPLLVENGLSTAEFDVLATLRNAPAPHDMTPSQIQQEVVITSGGLTKVMLQLEARGLVKRLQLPHDLRVKPVQLTDEGRQKVETAMTAMLGATRAWLKNGLDAGEIGQLTTLLSKVVAAPGQAGRQTG